MEENRALQVSHQTREMIETGAQAMIQQAITYLQDALHAPALRRENVELQKEMVELKHLLETADRENRILGQAKADALTEVEHAKASRDIIARHRDQLLNEASHLNEKLRKIRHSMDTMRGIMDSNLAA